MDLKNLFPILVLLSLLFISCGGDGDCDIRDITVDTGECNCEEDYSLTLNFNHDYAGDAFFQILLRANEHFGYYKFEDLPLTLDKFPLSGNADDFIKICVVDDPSCCEEFEWIPPDCTGTCSISDLEVGVGDCTSEETYVLELDFQYEHADNEFFDLFVRNDELIGYYRLADLPLRLEDFPISGYDYDFIKVCINDNPDCCKEIEFMPPSCAGDCKVFDLEADTGVCVNSDLYELNINFEYENATHTRFEVFVRNNVRIGNYALSELPLKIPEFERSGNDYDLIKVCMSDDPDCCEVIEFMPPDCDGECKIYDIVTEIGPCTSDSTYVLELDFQVDHPGNDFYELWVRDNIYLGYFRIDELPLRLDDFKLSGKDYDFLRICINDVPDCCKETEWMSPDC